MRRQFTQYYLTQADFGPRASEASPDIFRPALSTEGARDRRNLVESLSRDPPPRVGGRQNSGRGISEDFRARGSPRGHEYRA
jgi:hypothetical protein